MKKATQKTATKNGGIDKSKARLVRIAGPVAVAEGLNAKMYDVVLVGEEHLVGEIIQINGEKSIIQVYEDTSGLRPGAPVKTTGSPLSVELGPGLLTSIYDGIQRPLPELIKKTGDFIKRGARIPGLERTKKWKFVASAKTGSEVRQGSILGSVEEVPGFFHKILVPPEVSGTLTSIKSGSYNVTEPIGLITTKSKEKIPVFLKQEWPVRKPRPVLRRLAPTLPLITGQRVMDTLFPVAKGGTAIIPGPFGAGKTVNQHQLAKWSDADIIVYVGCGERGNEMTEVLVEFPKLKDPKSGAPLMNRTVLIANTSNMPVAAREASIYTGATIAEYFRDMGYDVAMMADSTSRWAEALREISSRLEEMPGEEGFPAYLSSRIAEFYERSGLIVPYASEGEKNPKPSSLTIIGAVSPPGGDFFEPVTQSSLRVAKTFWALDAKLAQQRHFPSVNWLESYSLYRQVLAPWYEKNAGKEWNDLIGFLSKTLQEESELLEIVQLVGSDALPETQQVTLFIARLIREAILQQSAFDDVDSYCPIEKSYLLMQLIRKYNSASMSAVKTGVHPQEILKQHIGEAIHALRTTKKYEEEGQRIERMIVALSGERT